MEMKDLLATARLFGQKTAFKARSLGPVGRALWHSGIPSRFWLFLFVLGIVLGVAAKSYAVNHFTIGENDYRLLPASRGYDVNAIEDQITERGQSILPSKKTSPYPSDPIDTDTGL